MNNEMDGTDQYWLKLWQTITIGTVLIVMCMSGCRIHENNKIAEAIKGGGDPVKVRFAYTSQPTSVDIAAMLATKK